MVGRAPSLSGPSSHPSLPHGKHRRVSSNLPRTRLAHSMMKAILQYLYLGMKGIHFVSIGDLCTLSPQNTLKYYVAALK